MTKFQAMQAGRKYQRERGIKFLVWFNPNYVIDGNYREAYVPRMANDYIPRGICYDLAGRQLDKA